MRSSGSPRPGAFHRICEHLYGMAPGETNHSIGKPTGQGVWLGPPFTLEFKYLRIVDRTTADCHNRINLSTTLDATLHAVSGLEVSVLGVSSGHSGAVGGESDGRRSMIRERSIPAEPGCGAI